jgi:hypothetical protein
VPLLGSACPLVLLLVAALWISREMRAHGRKKLIRVC